MRSSASKSPKLPIREALAILRACARGTCDAEELADIAGSRSTFFRILRSLRKELGVSIDWDASLGGYRVTDWGLINRRRLI